MKIYILKYENIFIEDMKIYLTDTALIKRDSKQFLVIIRHVIIRKKAKSMPRKRRKLKQYLSHGACKIYLREKIFYMEIFVVKITINRQSISRDLLKKQSN